jgi:hypothetical protein
MAAALLLVRLERDGAVSEGDGPPSSLFTHEEESTMSLNALGSVVDIKPASQVSGRSWARISYEEMIL